MDNYLKNKILTLKRDKSYSYLSLNILVIFLLALFYVSFIQSDQLINGIWTGKTFYFYGVCVIAFTLITFNLLFKREAIKLNFNILDISLIAFYLYSVIRLVFTEEVPTYNARIITFTLLLILYFIFKKYFSNYNFNKVAPALFIIIAFLLAGLFQACIGLFQAHNLFGYYSGFFLAYGTFGNPAPYTGFIISVLPFSLGLYLLLEPKNIPTTILKYLGLVTFCATIFVLPVTKTRGGWLAAIGGISVVLFYKYNLSYKIGKILNKPYKKVLTTLLTLALMVVVLGGLYQLRPSSAFGRVLIWKVSSNIIKEYPIFGIGYDRFGQVYNKYQANYFAEKDRDEFEKYVAGNVKQAHNEYIETTAELGMIGLFLFLGILVSAIFRISNINMNNKNKNSELRIHNSEFLNASKASIIALMISGFFSYPFQILPTLLNFIFLLSIISTFGNYKTVHSVKIKNSHLKYLSIIVLPLLAFLSITQIDRYNKLIKWNEAVALSHFQSYNKAINIYKDLYPKLKTTGNFLVNYGGVLALNKQYKEAVEILEEGTVINSDPNLFVSLGNSYKGIKKYKNAETNYKIASNIIPHKYYPKYLLVKLYKETKRIEEAKILAQQIIAMKEKISSTATYQIKNEMKKILEL